MVTTICDLNTLIHKHDIDDNPEYFLDVTDKTEITMLLKAKNTKRGFQTHCISNCFQKH